MMKIVHDDPVLNGISVEGRKFWADFDGEIKAPICRALLKRYFPKNLRGFSATEPERG
jgi:hypothetical protein